MIRTCYFLLSVVLLGSVGGCKIEIRQEARVDREQSAGGTGVRIMTYNTQYLSAAAAGHGDRVEKLRRIIEDIGPTIVGMQEMDDRAAMELIYPPDAWDVVIDDDSRDKQDVAFAVRKPWRITNVPADLDADDEHFLAAGRENESFFPMRRDGLFIQVESPDGSRKLTVVNIHAKSRRDGRAETDGRREGASRVMVEMFKTRLKGQDIVLLGDFNDSPDDASLNILESGDGNAKGRMEDEPDGFMMNLCEPLWAKGMVTYGASAKRLDRVSGLINILYPEARARNDNTRGRVARSGPILFDQILVSQSLKEAVVKNSTVIYRKPVALEGEGYSRASDHLPVYVDLR